MSTTSRYLRASFHLLLLTTTPEHALLTFSLWGAASLGQALGFGVWGCMLVSVATLGARIRADVVSGPGKES